MFDMRLMPERASTFAPQVDLIFYFLVGLSLLFFFGICGALIYLSLRYRRANRVDRSYASPDNTKLELTWTIIPIFMVLGVFVWVSVVYSDMMRAPDSAMEILVTGKQWMWKIQHPNGRREINELHVPVGQPVRLTMISEDVVHSFFVPAFRAKMDVLPGRYSSMWFEATKPGEYHLFCAEYCGTGHSHMVGRVIAMEPANYEKWLGGRLEDLSPASAGERLFARLGCVTCHRQDSGARGPWLAGVFESEVTLQTGEVVIADEDYLRESILSPNAKIVEGYAPLMPSYQGMLNPDELNQLIAYIKSLEE